MPMEITGSNHGLAAVIRDTLYIDGGNLWWSPGMSDGSIGPLSEDGEYEFNHVSQKTDSLLS